MNSKFLYDKRWYATAHGRVPTNSKSVRYRNFLGGAVDQSVYNRAMAVSRKIHELTKNIWDDRIVNKMTKIGDRAKGKKVAKNFRSLCDRNRHKAKTNKINQELIASRIEPPDSAFSLANFSGQDGCSRHGIDRTNLAPMFSHVDLKIII